jgi:hypothetical protein
MSRIKKLHWLLLMAVLTVGLGSVAHARTMSLFGKISWATGAPVIGLEVKLAGDNRELAKTFTNDNGMYAFFDLPKPLQNVVITVSDRAGVLKQVHVEAPDPGGRVADIVIE